MQYDVKFFRLVKGFTEFRNQRDTKIMYYQTVTQDVDDSLRLTDLCYELTDMGGYDKDLEEFKKEYIAQKLKEEKERVDLLKKQENERHKIATAEEKINAKSEGRKVQKLEKIKIPSATAPVNEVDGGDFNYEWIPLRDMLHPYASGDVDVCLRIHNILIEKIEKDPQMADLTKVFYPELTDVLAELEANGVKMDIEYNKMIEEKYNEEADRLAEEMRKIPIVKQFEDECITLYERGLAEWQKKPADRDPEIAKLRDKYSVPKGKSKFNPNSDVMKPIVLYRDTEITLPFGKDYLKDSAINDGVSEDEVEWFHYKGDTNALEYIVKHYPEHKELATLLLEHSLVKTRKNGFIHKLRRFLDDNGYMHGKFNATGTECVSGDTLLVTDRGIQEIQSLDGNRTEKSFSDIDITIHSAIGAEKADGFYYNGVREGKRITLMDGTELTTSLSHPLLRNIHLSSSPKNINKRNTIFKKHLKNVEWSQANTLKVGDSIALKIGTNLYGNKTLLSYDSSEYTPTPTSHTKHATLPTEMTEELAEWLGMYMADGGVNESNHSINIHLTNDDLEVTSRFEELTKEVFNLDVNYTHYEDKSTCVRISSVHVGRWLKEAIELPIGSMNKDVPKAILAGSKNVQKAFIRGLSLDSSTEKKAYPSLYFSSVSYKLMRKVKAMLLNMGVYCRESVSKEYRDNYRDLYSVIVTYKHLREFMDTIGVVENIKRVRIEDRFNKYKNRQGTGKMTGVVESDDYVFVKIKSIEDTKTELFDLHVPKSHSFIGNGVVNHNTSRLSSSGPNLQNIPSKASDPNRFDYKFPIKRMFVSGFEGGAILQADFAALEMRVLALASMDESMISSFMKGLDMHKETASFVYGVSMDEVTAHQRQKSKAVK